MVKNILTGKYIVTLLLCINKKEYKDIYVNNIYLNQFLKNILC